MLKRKIKNSSVFTNIWKVEDGIVYLPLYMTPLL